MNVNWSDRFIFFFYLFKIAGALGTTVSLALIERLTIHSCTKNASHSGIHTNTSGVFLNSSLATGNTTCYTLDGNNVCEYNLHAILCTIFSMYVHFSMITQFVVMLSTNN